ncbi:MAG: hypothetical protein H6Q05_2077 [Acidobacteria bacterium]|nr:hypothetical protein [Acidobacteriota bacterium]
MKPKFKKLFLWSSLGSIAIGTAVAMARRSRKDEPRPLACRKVPGDCLGAVLWTGQFEVEENGEGRFAHDRYTLQPTSFRVWSVLDLPVRGESAPAGSAGSAIYHVTQMRCYQESAGEGSTGEERLVERFYGIVTAADDAGRTCGSNAIARGGFLEIRKCYVGGASNGVESGEVHRSRGKILNYRIEFAPPA